MICDHARLPVFHGGRRPVLCSRTTLADFPANWGDPQEIRHDERAEFFEATCTYRLKGLDKYLTLAEAIGPHDRRYYKAFLADRLDGEWVPLAGTWVRPFASIENVTLRRRKAVDRLHQSWRNAARRIR